MKKRRILALILGILCVGTPTLALENIYPQVCPLNVQPAVTQGADGAQVALTVFNATDYPVTYLEFSLNLYDGSGAPATDGVSNFFRAYAEGLSLQPYRTQKLYWSAAEFAGAAEVRDFHMDKVVFWDGTEWTASAGKLYSAPYMYAENSKNGYGQHILNSAHALQLVDYSYSSSARTWSIWNDEYGFMPFSTDLIATCYVWAPTARIRLTVNDDPALTTEETFSVISSPGVVGFTPYATETPFTLMPVLTGNAPVPDEGLSLQEVYVPLNVGDVPCCIGLWDYTDSTVRQWSIWDGSDWIPFSYERGPICEIWHTGKAYIKLAYADTAAVYALHISGLY